MAAPSDRIEHSRSALAHAVSSRTWRQALSLGRSDATLAPAIRVGLATAVVLIAGGLIGRPELAGFAALGATCSAFGRYEPYPRRAGKLALVGGMIVLYATLAALVGVVAPSAAIEVIAVSIAAGAAALLLAAFAVMGPGAVIPVFASTAAIAFAHTAADVVTVFLATAVGALVGLGAALLPALLHPAGPAQLAVARALAAVDAHRGTPRDEPARAAIAHARTVVTLNGGARADRHRLALMTLLDDAEGLLDAWARGDDPAHAETVLAHERALRALRRYDGLPTGAAVALPAPPRSFFAEGLARITSRPLILNGIRIAIAAALAAWCASALGFEHPLWATMGAVAAMQGVTFQSTVQRGIQRLLGNMAGAAIAAGLLALSPGYWQAVLAVVAFQVTAELLVVKNYALLSIAVTPMALILTGLAGHLSPTVAIDRVGDTLVGVLIGITVAAVTIEIGDRQHLPAPLNPGPNLGRED